MANRESLMNALIELECTPTTYSRELLRKNWVEALTTAEFDPCDRLDGRTANKELSVYDAMMAEIYAEKSARMRKYMRKHEIRNDGKPVRKEKRKSYQKEKCYQCSPWNGWDIVRNVRIAEKIRTDAEDWKLEQDAIAEEEEWERFNRELEEFDRQWREQAKAEQERVRKAREAIEFNEWLKWA